MTLGENSPSGYPLYAPYAKLYILTATTTLDPNLSTALDLVGTTTLSAQLASSTSDTQTAIVKSVTVTAGTRDMGQIITMGSSTDRDIEGGSTSDNTLSIANAIREDKRMDVCSIKFTVIAPIFSNAAKTNHIVYLLGGAPNLMTQIGSTGVYFSRGGWKTTANTDRQPHPIVLYVNNGTDRIWYFMNYAVCTDMEWSTDAESHQECTVTMKCLPRDFWVQIASGTE